MSKSLRLLLVVVILAVVAFFVGNWYVAKQAKATIDEQLAALNADPAAELVVSYENVSANILTSSLEVSGLTIKHPEYGDFIIIDSVTSSNLWEMISGDVALEGRSAMTGMRFSDNFFEAQAAGMPAAPGTLDALKEVSIDAYSDVSYEKGDDLFHVKMGIEDKQLVSLDFDIDVSNVRDAMYAIAEQQQQGGGMMQPMEVEKFIDMLKDGVLHELTMRVADHGLINAYLDMMAQQSGMKADQMRDMMAMQISQMQPLDATGNEALVGFIKGNNGLKLHWKPSQPMSFADIEQLGEENRPASPEEAFELFGISITAD
ncbi:DUF945 family protein [Idiomarina xiamenensis]|uniref:DUF945 domain-containing protein n=1 Tax=Idiomarina xiamenensis 10-D-4 TaxID=740709 RepID=K2KHH5_9GAMM|nr:DUF945 family protein [Idiomarina xiamenensis]EKE87453.1 hypothetical protein A10D4_00115 [Idiomarina xiamenensis 10-D-4]